MTSGDLHGGKRRNSTLFFKLTLQLKKFRLNFSSFDSSNWRMLPHDSVPLNCFVSCTTHLVLVVNPQIIFLTIEHGPKSSCSKV